MEAGVTVYKAYVFGSDCDYYLWEGKSSGIIIDGVEMVRHGTSLVPIDGWHLSATDAKRGAAARMAVLIGQSQAKLDKLRDEILHEDLASNEVAA